MNDIASAINKKTIHCSFLFVSLTDYLCNLTTRYRYEELNRLHDSPDSFIDECIDYVVNRYIEKAVELFETVLSLEENKSKQFLWANYQDTFIRCKEHAKERRFKRQEDEKYLGKKSFSDEIHRSFNEFLVVVKSSFGFLPYDHSKVFLPGSKPLISGQRVDSISSCNYSSYASKLLGSFNPQDDNQVELSPHKKTFSSTATLICDSSN